MGMTWCFSSVTKHSHSATQKLNQTHVSTTPGLRPRQPLLLPYGKGALAFFLPTCFIYLVWPLSLLSHSCHSRSSCLKWNTCLEMLHTAKERGFSHTQSLKWCLHLLAAAWERAEIELGSSSSRNHFTFSSNLENVKKCIQVKRFGFILSFSEAVARMLRKNVISGGKAGSSFWKSPDKQFWTFHLFKILFLFLN